MQTSYHLPQSSRTRSGIHSQLIKKGWIPANKSAGKTLGKGCPHSSIKRSARLCSCMVF
ncbi:protein of unknown function [Shewanella benthica]|uniref:Uncharacterized protein n=1 Tax=Shewanella benthica TaxID=43661 RepID=A0A330M3N6_9GAMM|nr:protein of unknown function [Shewanella benthica]